MDEQQKDSYIRVRVSSELKSKVYAKCKRKSINFSDWFRQQAEKFCKGEK